MEELNENIIIALWNGFLFCPDIVIIERKKEIQQI